jgi:hypothetical protein
LIATDKQQQQDFLPKMSAVLNVNVVWHFKLGFESTTDQFDEILVAAIARPQRHLVLCLFNIAALSAQSICPVIL